MSDKHCCVTWESLAPELVDAKRIEIDSLMENSKLPKSVFASVFKVLDSMLNYCPSCGSCLNQELNKKQVVINPAQHKKAIAEVEEATQEKPNYNIVKLPCKACAGKGILGVDRNKVKINCMKCHGSGFFESKHIAEDPRAKVAQSKVDDLRETSGIGDNGVFAPEGE